MSETSRLIEGLATKRGTTRSEIIDSMARDVFWTSPEEAYEIIERGAVPEDVAFFFDLERMLELDEDEVVRLFGAAHEDFDSAEQERLSRERGH